MDGCVAVNNKEKKAWCQNILNKWCHDATARVGVTYNEIVFD